MSVPSKKPGRNRGFVGGTAILFLLGASTFFFSTFYSICHPDETLKSLFGTVHTIGQWRIEFDEGMHFDCSGDFEGLHGSIFRTYADRLKPVHHYARIEDIDKDNGFIHVKYALLSRSKDAELEWRDMRLGFEQDGSHIRITQVIPSI